MAEEVASLGFGVETDGIEKAVIQLKRLSDAGEQVDKSFSKGTGAAKETGDAAKVAGKGAEEAAKAFSSFIEETKKMAQSSSAMAISAKQMSDSVTAAAGAFGKFQEETKRSVASTDALSSSARKLGGILGSAFALGKTINTITSFEDSILRLQATSNASASAMAEMEKQSRLLGATSRFSAQQAADAQNFLAMAGLKTNEILSATPSVMKFASAASIDLARSADIATNVLGGMQLPVDQLDRVMNTMVVTAQSANTNIDQLGSAFAYAAPIAVTAAVDVETLAAAVGVLGDAGIQGGRAGTGMVGVIRQLSNATPDAQKALAAYGITMADVDIKTRGLTNVLDTLNKANLDTGDAMRIFGSESAAAALILSASVDKVEELTSANKDAEGQLNKVANLLDSSVSASFAGVTSAIDEMMIRTGDKGLSGTLKILAITTAGVINNFNGMLPEFAEANGLSSDFTRNIGFATTALQGLGVTVGLWALIRGGLYGATQAQLAFNLAARANPYVAIATAIAGAAAVLYQFTTAQDKAAIETKRLWDNAVGSAAAYQLAATNLANTQNTLNSLHHKELKLQDEMQVMRDKGFKQYGWHADQYRKKEEELLSVQTQRKELLDSKVAADKEEGLRQIEANKRQEEANKLQKELAKIQKEAEDREKAGLATAKEAEKALKALEAERKKALAAQVKSADAIRKGNEELKREIEQTGKVGSQLVELERQRNNASIAALKEKAVTLELAKGRKNEVIAIREQIKELVERNRLVGESYAAKAVADIKKKNEALREEIQQIGKTKRELVVLEQARIDSAVAVLEEQVATLSLVEGREAETEALREQIKELKDRRDLLGEKIDTEEVHESQKKIADQWKSLSDDMGKTFTDAIIQGGANAKEAVKRMFTNMILRPIVEPIAQGVANMFTGMLGGGKSGGLLSGLFGGESGKGGSSFGLGDIASMGKNVYSAFTGWGKAIYTGFAEGGFTGAMKGFGSYLSNGFSTMTAKLGSMFGGGTATAGAASSGASAGAGGAAMSNPVGWGIAALLGSMNFYKAGYTLDHKQVANQKLSKISFGIDPVLSSVFDSMMKATQFASKNLLEPLFGKKWGNILSLGPLFSGVSNTVNKALFGGAWKTKDVGLGLGFDGGEFTGQQYEYRKKKGGLFSSSKKKTIWTALDEEVHDALSEAMAESVSGTRELFEALGFEIADDALSGLKTGTKQISTKGKDEEKIQEEIAGWLLDTSEAVAGELHKVLGTGLDMDLESLTGFVTNLLGVNEVLGILGLNAYDSSIAGAELAQTLSGLAGGLESLAGASDVYYKNFFTAEEQFEHTFDALTKALNDAELGAIGSREAYREMVEGLDLTTESGQEMLATMLGMSGAAAEYFGIMEGYQNQLAGMTVALNAEPVLGYSATLLSLQDDFDAMAKELAIVGLATEENLDTLEQFRQKMAEMAALDLFDGGQGMADALRQGLMGTWDGEAIGDYLARSISDGVYGAIAGQFANQITDILLQGIVGPMINAALTGASISEAVTAQSIQAIVAQAQAVAEVAAGVMGALKESGVMDELRKALGGGFTLPKADYTAPAYRPPVTPSYSAPKVDDSWKNLLESIIKQTERAQQQIADMGRTTYEKGLASIAGTVADYQDQIAKSTASRRKLLMDELDALESAERKLLEAQMDQRAADMLAGIANELDRMGKTDAELALMNIEKQTLDYIKSLHDVGRATAENIAQVEDWAEAMREAAAKDAQIKAASGAYDALSRAVDAQRSVITDALNLAKNVADAAGNAAKSLFEDVLGASASSAEQARSFIADALQAARATGYLPDADGLRSAIDAATRGFDDATAVSLADANWQKLVLANQLKELADLAEPQVDFAQQQLDALDRTLDAAREQVDLLKGIDNSVLSVADALKQFNEITGGQIRLPEAHEVQMPPAGTFEPQQREDRDSGLLAEVIALRRDFAELSRNAKRTAEAVNGRGDAPMIVEVV